MNLRFIVELAAKALDSTGNSNKAAGVSRIAVVLLTIATGQIAQDYHNFSITIDELKNQFAILNNRVTILEVLTRRNMEQTNDEFRNKPNRGS